MKKLNESYIKERIMSSPIFDVGVFSQKDIINSEISSLEILAGMIKGRQLEFFSSNNEENDFENNEENIKEIEDKVEKNYDELEQLENLNFSIQNEIQKIDYLSNKTKDRIYFLKRIEFFQEETREYFITNNKDIIDIEKYLKNELIRLKQHDKELKEKIKMDNNELIELQFKIDRYKTICQNQKFDKKYISTDDVIEEELTQTNQISYVINSKDNQENHKENNEINSIPKGLRKRSKSSNSFDKIFENNECINKIDNKILKQNRRFSVNNINKKRISLPKTQLNKSKSINLDYCNIQLEN